MIYFTVSETIRAVAAFLFLGICLGGIYTSFNRILDFLFFCLTLVKKVFTKYIKSNVLSKSSKRTKIFVILSDFLFVITSGIFFILIQYVFLDGMFRIYAVLSFLVGYISSFTTLGKLLSKILSIILSKIEIIITEIAYILFYPFYLTVKISLKILTPIIYLLKRKYTKKLFSIKKKNKEREIAGFFKKYS